MRLLTEQSHQGQSDQNLYEDHSRDRLLWMTSQTISHRQLSELENEDLSKVRPLRKAV
jgi:hypothetical protein